jgi:DNA-binding MarR family transcriptional regulator
VQALLSLGYLTAKTDKEDKRIRWLTITQKGLDVRQAAINVLGPDISAIFSHWNESQLHELFVMLDKLKIHLDENRG